MIDCNDLQKTWQRVASIYCAAFQQQGDNNIQVEGPCGAAQFPLWRGST
jgi:hypothetical protein